MLEIEILKDSLLEISISKIKELTTLFLAHERQLPIKANEIITTHQDIAKPNEHEAYEAALKFLNGHIENNAYFYDLIAFALNKPIIELSGATVLSNEEKLSELLDIYCKEINSGDFLELTYLGVLRSYFEIATLNNSAEIIRVFLESNFIKISQLNEYNPLWMRSLNENLHLLSKEPCAIYGLEWLNGRDDRVTQIKSNIQIPTSSWFWNELVVSCVKETTKLDDFQFKQAIPKLLKFIKQHASYVDEGLLATLARYRNCSDTTLNKILKILL